MHWLLAHFLGDFVIQSDWLAVNKKKYWSVALLHVLTYLVPFLFTGLPVWKLGLIGVQHLVQDRTNFVLWFMKVKGSYAFSQPLCGPWSVIVIDNILHIVWISLVVAL